MPDTPLSVPPAPSAQAILAQVDRRASRLLVVGSLAMLASLGLGPQHAVTEALEILLVFLGGLVLGVIWSTQAVRHGQAPDALDRPPPAA
jgi:hypothetical protein